MTVTSKQADIRIRHYQAGDAPAMARIFFESVRCLGPRCYTFDQVVAWAPAPPDPALIHARVIDGRIALIAVNRTGEAVAFAELETAGHFDQLYCLADWSGMGIASMLVDMLLDHAVSVGMQRVFVEASELALALFEHKGFEIICCRNFKLRGIPIHNYAMELILHRNVIVD